MVTAQTSGSRLFQTRAEAGDHSVHSDVVESGLGVALGGGRRAARGPGWIDAETGAYAPNGSRLTAGPLREGEVRRRTQFVCQCSRSWFPVAWLEFCGRRGGQVDIGKKKHRPGCANHNLAYPSREILQTTQELIVPLATVPAWDTQASEPRIGARAHPRYQECLMTVRVSSH